MTGGMGRSFQVPLAVPPTPFTPIAHKGGKITFLHSSELSTETSVNKKINKKETKVYSNILVHQGDNQGKKINSPKGPKLAV